MDVKAVYNRIRYQIESEAARGGKDARQIAESEGLEAPLVDWLAHFPKWKDTPEKLASFAAACKAVYEDPAMPILWRAITAENGASAAGAMNDVEERLKLQELALNLVEGLKGTSEYEWIKLSVETGRMDALPETYDVDKYHGHAKTAVNMGLFNAPGMAHRTSDKLIVDGRLAEAQDLGNLFKGVSETGIHNYSLGQRERFEKAYPDIFKDNEDE